jgi:predicted transcriptional regulator of viral defense system
LQRLFTLKTNDFFSSMPIFRRTEFEAHLAQLGPTNPRNTTLLLGYHEREGRLLQVRRGLYAVVPRGIVLPAAQPDHYLLASNLQEDAVLAYRTALDFHRNALPIRSICTYLTRHTPRSFTFRGILYRPVHPPAALSRSDRERMGINTLKWMTASVRVTQPERTLVDILDRPDLCGCWAEIWQDLTGLAAIDLDFVVRYALALENASTIARVGYFLEQHREPVPANEAILRRLERGKPRSKHYLERSHRVDAHFIKRWNLVVPDSIWKWSGE